MGNKKNIVLIILFWGYYYSGQGQYIHKSAVLLISEVQVLNPQALTFGFGIQPRTTPINFIRINPDHSFIGVNFLYNKSLIAKDWGTALQLAAFSGNTAGPMAFGIEGNMQQIDNKPYFGVKPFLGLSLPFGGIVYGYHVGINEKTKYNGSQLIISWRYPLIKRW